MQRNKIQSEICSAHPGPDCTGINSVTSNILPLVKCFGLKKKKKNVE